MKGIKREFSVHGTPQQNGIAERKNRTLVKAAKTTLANSLLPIPYWAEAVNTVCYVQNMILVTKPQNKTPCELLHGRTPSISFMRSFGCLVTILNTLDSLGKFDRKVDEGFLVSSAQSKKHDDKTKREAKGKSPVESFTGYKNLSAEFKDLFDNSINKVNAAGSLVLDVGQISSNNTNTFSAASPSNATVSLTHRKSLYVDSSQLHDDPDMLELEDITYFDDEEDVGAEADFTNLETSITVSSILTTNVHKDHHKLWVLVDLPNGKRAIGTKWVFRNKKDERGIVFRNKARLVVQGHTQEEGIDYEEVFALVLRIEAIRNKARLVAQRHTQEEGIDYEEVFALVARIEAIRLFLAYASFMGFLVYQMDVKSAFLYETIEEEVYVCQPPGFEDPGHPDKVYKVFNALYGLHQAPRACLTYGKSASTPIDTEKLLLKDPNGEDVDVHTYRSMIGSLMYLISSRPDIIYLKGNPHLGLWYPKDSPFNLVAYLDSDYAGASLDRKSTTRGCQFIRCRLISWQCKKQTVVATSSTKAEYVVAAIKKVNDMPRIQALVDKKKVIITEATIRDVLRLDDAKGIECLPNEEIFTELARMGDEKPSTNLIFYKAFFSSQWKFLIHTIHQCMSAKRTLWNEFRMIVAQQVGEGDDEVNVEDVPAAGNEGAASVNDDDVPAAVDEPSIPSPTPSTQPPPTSQDIPSTSHEKIAQALEITKLKQRVKKFEKRDKLKAYKLRRLKKDVVVVAKDVKDAEIKESLNVQGRKAESQAQIYQIDLEHANKVLSMQDDDIEPEELQEVVKVVTTAKLITEVVTAASATITAAAP
nr:hypothetical protein [Tanacetum cinerariifolium]